MAGVVAALETHHHIGTLGQPIDDLAFALVAPLGAHHGDIGHAVTPPLVSSAMPWHGRTSEHACIPAGGPRRFPHPRHPGRRQWPSPWPARRKPPDALSWPEGTGAAGPWGPARRAAGYRDRG